MHLWSVMRQHILAVRVNGTVPRGEVRVNGTVPRGEVRVNGTVPRGGLVRHDVQYHSHAQLRYAAASPTINAFSN